MQVGTSEELLASVIPHIAPFLYTEDVCALAMVSSHIRASVKRTVKRDDLHCGALGSSKFPAYLTKLSQFASVASLGVDFSSLSFYMQEGSPPPDDGHQNAERTTLESLGLRDLQVHNLLSHGPALNILATFSSLRSLTVGGERGVELCGLINHISNLSLLEVRYCRYLVA